MPDEVIPRCSLFVPSARTLLRAANHYSNILNFFIYLCAFLIEFFWQFVCYCHKSNAEMLWYA